MRLALNEMWVNIGVQLEETSAWRVKQLIEWFMQSLSLRLDWTWINSWTEFYWGLNKIWFEFKWHLNEIWVQLEQHLNNKFGEQNLAYLQLSRKCYIWRSAKCFCWRPSQASHPRREDPQLASWRRPACDGHSVHCGAITSPYSESLAPDIGHEKSVCKSQWEWRLLLVGCWANYNYFSSAHFVQDRLADRLCLGYQNRVCEELSWAQGGGLTYNINCWLFFIHQ